MSEYSDSSEYSEATTISETCSIEFDNDFGFDEPHETIQQLYALNQLLWDQYEENHITLDQTYTIYRQLQCDIQEYIRSQEDRMIEYIAQARAGNALHHTTFKH